MLPRSLIRILLAYTVYGIGISNTWSGAPGLVDRVFAVHTGSRRFNSHRLHMSERFFWSSRPEYQHPLCSELQNSGIRWQSVIAVSLSVGGGVHLIKSAKLHMCTQTHYKHDEDGRTVPGVRGHASSVPLSHSGNVFTRIGLHTHTHTRISNYNAMSLWAENFSA